MPTLLGRARAIQQEYPRQFWVLFFGSLINNAGNGLVFPFFSLYLTLAVQRVTRQLKFSMTEVGIAYAAFAVTSVISQVVYSQMNTTLPVYLNRDFGFSEQWYGLLMSLNALLVVLFQFPLTRRTSHVDKSVMMALGNGFYAIGFGMFGFVSGLPLFFVAQATWTLGEMLAVPVAQTLVADFAPDVMHGRYMGVYGVASAVAFGLGPLLGGMLMDGIGGRYIWYAAILLDGLVLLGFLALRGVFKRRAMG